MSTLQVAHGMAALWAGLLTPGWSTRWLDSFLDRFRAHGPASGNLWRGYLLHLWVSRIDLIHHNTPLAQMSDAAPIHSEPRHAQAHDSTPGDQEARRALP